jgi:hypothetical protein
MPLSGRDGAAPLRIDIGALRTLAGKRGQVTDLNGAGDRDRTDDIQLGKLSFYH